MMTMYCILPPGVYTGVPVRCPPWRPASRAEENSDEVNTGSYMNGMYGRSDMHTTSRHGRCRHPIGNYNANELDSPLLVCPRESRCTEPRARSSCEPQAGDEER